MVMMTCELLLRVTSFEEQRNSAASGRLGTREKRTNDRKPTSNIFATAMFPNSGGPTILLPQGPQFFDRNFLRTV